MDLIEKVNDLQEGDFFKITDIHYNKLSGISKHNFVGVFEIVEKEKNNISKILPNKPKKKIKIRNLNGEIYQILIKRDTLIIYDDKPNGVNIHGEIKGIKRTKYKKN